MKIALTQDHHDLLEVVDKFCAKQTGPDHTRLQSDLLAAGGLPDFWTGLQQLGLHAMALPSQCGGGDSSLEDLAVVVEGLGRHLVAGPFVPTVVASAVLATASAGAARDAALSRFAEGATGALVRGDFSARATDNDDNDSGWVLEGSSEAVVGAGAATVVLVEVQMDNRQQWVVVDRAADGFSSRAEAGTDASRDASRVRLDSVRVERSAVMVGLDQSQVEAIEVSLWAAEAAGLMRWAVEAATEYAGVREQFGHPIGSFQAVKHKCARLLVRAELAAAASWGAVLSVGQDAAQRYLAVGTARLMSLAQAPDAVLEAITVFGGIGFTWEHEAHLYERRALALASTVGPVSDRRRELGEVSMTTGRHVEVNLPHEEPAFRAWVAETLDEAAGLVEDTDRSPHSPGGAGAYRRLLGEKGLIAPHWPRPWGLDSDASAQVVISQEFVRRGLPQPSTVIGEWAVPTLLAHGTDEQRQRLVAGTVSGDVVWCQLFSEPGAGSDLAGLRTSATKVDGGWRLNGQKVWTSGAHEASWGICLARTDPDVPKHRGLSFFLVDMAADGIDVRPIKQSNGSSHFNEVFLSEVFVPDNDLVGEPGQGWRIATTTLNNERTSIGSGMSEGAEVVVRDLARDLGVTETAAAQQALGAVTADSIAIGSLNVRETLKRLHGMQPGAGSSLAKVAAADLARSSAQAMVELGGRRALLAGTDGLALHYLGVPAHLLGGGTVEIQLNVIAERVLGLPRA